MSVASTEIMVIEHGCTMNNPNCCVEDVFTESRAVIKIEMNVVHEWCSPSLLSFKYSANGASIAYSAEVGFGDLLPPGSVDVNLAHLENLESRIQSFCRDSCNVKISNQHICDLKRMLCARLQKRDDSAEDDSAKDVSDVIKEKPKEVNFVTWFAVRALHICLDEQEFDEDYEEFIKHWGHLFFDVDQLRDPSSSLALLKTRDFVEDDSETNDNSCAVCLEMLPVGQKIRETPCLHLYHMHCIRKWFEKTNTCPMCRKILGD